MQRSEIRHRVSGLDHIAVVSATAANALSVLTECERLVAGRPEIELLSARQRLFNEEE